MTLFGSIKRSLTRDVSEVEKCKDSTKMLQHWSEILPVQQSKQFPRMLVLLGSRSILVQETFVATVCMIGKQKDVLNKKASN